MGRQRCKSRVLLTFLFDGSLSWNVHVCDVTHAVTAHVHHTMAAILILCRPVEHGEQMDLPMITSFAPAGKQSVETLLWLSAVHRYPAGGGGDVTRADFHCRMVLCSTVEPD